MRMWFREFAVQRFLLSKMSFLKIRFRGYERNLNKAGLLADMSWKAILLLLALIIAYVAFTGIRKAFSAAFS